MLRARAHSVLFYDLFTRPGVFAREMMGEARPLFPDSKDIAMQPTSSAPSINPALPAQHNGHFWKMTLGVIGVVYGDIGTSPIYAFREALHTIGGGGAPAVADVLGILSLIVWALAVIVTLKYVIILLRVDNAGEGGTLALMTLARKAAPHRAKLFLLMGMGGAALFYGDSIITPALSVLSAVEGLEVVSPAFTHYILPITTAIIFALFIVQSHGTHKVSAFFGPIIIVWFGALAWMGAVHIMEQPVVLMALNPYYAVQFLLSHGSIAFLTLGAVFLAVTGAEALYADLGHFGKRPIQAAWMWFVFPALVVNYMGQGALVLSDPSTADNPFFKMAPADMLIPLVFLSTLATIIASQAVITGAYSITQQAINLGLLPRMKICQTSATQQGQIYLPRVNYLMMTGVLLLIFVFRSSSNLATAYGISVTGTMVLTAVMLFFIVWRLWEKPLLAAMLLVLPLITIDGIFLASNLLKIFEGGWVALAVAGTIMLMMIVWVRGTFILSSRERKRQPRLEQFAHNYADTHPGLAVTKGTAFFFSPDPQFVPHALMINLRHNHALHESNIVLSVQIENTPYVQADARIRARRLNARFATLTLHYGFMESPDVQAALLQLRHQPHRLIPFDWETTSLFLSHKTLRADPRYGLPLWQDAVFMWLNHSAADPTDYYRLPTGRVVELGRHVVI